MIAFLLSKWGLRIIGCIGILVALGGLYYHVWHNGYIAGSAEVQKDWDADKAKREKALTDMTLLWDQQRQASEKAQQEAASERAKREQVASDRVRTLPPAVAAIRVPAVAIRVPNDALGGAAPTPRAAPEPGDGSVAAPGDSNVGLVIGWAVDVIGYYNACRDEVIGWQTFYQSLRNAQGKSEVTP